MRDTYPVLGYISGVLGGGAVELEEVDHACCRARQRKAAQAVGRLPRGQDRRLPPAEQGTRALDRVPGILGSVVAEEQRAVSACGHESFSGVGGSTLRRPLLWRDSTPSSCSSILFSSVPSVAVITPVDYALVEPCRQTVAGG